MSQNAATIAILCHRRDRSFDVCRWVIESLAQVWREDGHRVIYVFGSRRYEPADVAILHVDLSVVPRAYLRLAQRYPVALNASVADIRKSSVSDNVLHPGDRWDGPVIVKSNLNHAGAPDRDRRRLPRLASYVENRLRPAEFKSPRDYRVLPSLDDVPDECFRNPRLLVERFLPEKEGELFCVRLYEFLGDRSTCIRLLGPEPIVNARSAVAVEAVEPHPAVDALRRQMGFDYGKFDYVVHDGEPVLLDANTCTGAVLHETDEMRARRRHRAVGLYRFLDS